MFHQFKDYFRFSKNERKGVLLLVVLIFLLIVVKQSLIYFSPDFSTKIQHFDSLASQLEQLKYKEGIEFKARRRGDETGNIEDFDPNTFEVTDWQRLGLSEKQAQVIKNYQAKAGDFRSKEEVKKMFVISDELYTKIKSHILLPDTVTAHKSIKKRNQKKINRKWDRKPRILPKIEINTADTAEFKKLYGIGSFLAAKIVAYRDKLGGFHSKEQLKEVWGLSPETLTRLDTQLIFHETKLKRLSVNKSSVETLKTHPYIKWKIANSIVQYRKQHGDYLQLEDLKKSVLITDSIYDKIIPYLEL